MGKSLTETGDSAAQIRMVKDHLEQWDEGWLLVFDNYDEPDKFSEIRQFIPISRPRSGFDERDVANDKARR